MTLSNAGLWIAIVLPWCAFFGCLLAWSIRQELFVRQQTRRRSATVESVGPVGAAEEVRHIIDKRMPKIAGLRKLTSDMCLCGHRISSEHRGPCLFRCLPEVCMPVVPEEP